VEVLVLVVPSFDLLATLVSPYGRSTKVGLLTDDGTGNLGCLCPLLHGLERKGYLKASAVRELFRELIESK
jgi:hypothetical protein